MSLHWPPSSGIVTRARDIAHCTAGLLRFATPEEMDALLDVLPGERARHALHSHGMPNRVVAEAMLRRREPEQLKWLIDQALSCRHTPSLLGRLLDLDDPQVNERMLLAGPTPNGIPRNLRRQLAHQTSRRDGVTPVPLPKRTRTLLSAGRGRQNALDHALLYAADPDLAGRALRFLGAGADPHGAVRACRTLLDARRVHELRALVREGRLPAYRWGPEADEPSVLAYAEAAITSDEGARRLRELSERVRRPEILRSVGEIMDLPGRDPWARRRPIVATVVHRRHPAIPRVDWDAVPADARRWREDVGPLPRSAAAFVAARTDAPLDLLRMVVADHPGLAARMPDPAPEVLTDLCEQGAAPGADTILKVVGNGLVAGTLTARFVVDTVPDEVLTVVAESLWVPGMRGTARIRALLGRSGDVVLEPLFVDETGHGSSRRLREPGRRSHFDPVAAYGPGVRDLRGRITADDVLARASADAVLAPSDGCPDPRVLLRLAEHVEENLTGRPEAWAVALRLLEEGFAGSLIELLATAGAVTSRRPGSP